MTLIVKETKPDGTTVIGDNLDPKFEAVLKPGQWEQCNWDKAKVLEFVEKNRIPPSDFDAAQDMEDRKGRQEGQPAQ